MEKIDIEKMSNIDLSQDSVKSISDKCNELKSLRKQIEDEEEKLSTLKKESIIKFSGKFIKSPRAYRRTYILSNSEYANADQEYVFQFTDVAELKSAN